MRRSGLTRSPGVYPGSDPLALRSVEKSRHTAPPAFVWGEYVDPFFVPCGAASNIFELLSNDIHAYSHIAILKFSATVVFLQIRNPRDGGSR